MSNTLGKRKEREEETSDPAHHGSTLFVSNLPYTATSTDLKTLFSDIAPVRTAFVVTEQGSGVSKGVGYVSFAIREDASSAVEKISKEGIELNGRALRVQWAASKPKDNDTLEKPKEKPAKVATRRPVHPSGPRDPLAIRTVVIGGLPSSIDSKAIWKKVRKIKGAEKVEWPVLSEVGSEDQSIAHVLFSTPASANDAVSKLHAHVFKGSLLSATLKKRLDGLAKAPKKLKQATTTQNGLGPAPSRSSRLIVRNMPFNITEQDLRAIFLPYGPIYSVDIPEKKDTPADGDEEDDAENKQVKRPRRRGFAFVWMLSKKDAEKALEGCNGMTVQAGMAEQIVSDKQKRKKQRREEKKLSQLSKAKVEGEGEESAEESEEERTDAQRVIAVDWALSKDKWEKEKAKIEEEKAEQEDVEMADVKGEDEESGEGERSDDEHIGVHNSDEHEDSDSDTSDGGASDDEDGDEEDRKPVKPTLPPPETGTTLFVRNVPFEATDDDLRTLFRAFGPLRYARVAMDPETGRSRGTGFVCFWNIEHADKAVEQSQILRAETTGGGSVQQPKKNPFKLPSLLTPDPSASIAQSLVLHGRTLDVIRAVTRDEAGKLKEAGERQREKADKRNLYLLREGIVLPNTPAAELLPPAEVEKRTQSFNARRALLRSNPSLYVSRTRLSIRQLPIHATERMLKRLAIHAVRAFEAEAKHGTRQGLTEDELAEVPADDAQESVKEEAEPSEQRDKKGKRKAQGRNTGVKQAKIVRQHDRVDPITGKGRSKGYGFLEMTTHADALRVLRWANNNPSVSTLFSEWWKKELQDLLTAEKKKEKKDDARILRIKEELERGASAKSRGTLIAEFSIENIQVVHRRAEKQNATGEQNKRPRPSTSVKTEESEPSFNKKRRLSASSPDQRATKDQKADIASAGVKQERPGQNIGSVIGRKRKERRNKKGGA
ncbi:hypothetical protein CERSUDRAFT_106374 [Gelatoporia subvermispora B]|uniref:RRM domain-containing protein n=1 Tax=Ceriporiopsis subvermispora (strain B) TaxID=914234 RepID=M2QWN0_CERS8|nr:hypothetical protein CERSUDRAFT_106374 [Gelatoporia subvermispora B]